MQLYEPTELPLAVANLLRQNHYQVTGPLQVHGAEIDLVARSLSDPFASPIYIEVTVEHVDNEKYGKDLTKLALVRAAEPTCRVMIVSSSGFTINVRERARETRIDTYTFKELFALFEKFEPYVQHILGTTETQFTEQTSEANLLRRLADVYQTPQFVDTHGHHDAVSWLDNWLTDADGSHSWLIIVGEYGTGKTALTRMMQKRWLERYTADTSLPIPVRIELGAFTRQFDAQSLLHHFLDNNHLGHVPIDFLRSLIESGRVVLLLDGYDEMAQYLSNRERRVCLQTLAELTSGGARGLLTSRPNYFSTTEELNLFDHLYRSIETRSQYLQVKTAELKKRETEIDELIERSILERYERALQDLSPEQTEQLVRGILQDNAEVADEVIRVLHRVFRATGEGSTVALSGKPVIISYLIDVAEGLKENVDDALTEWQVYTLVLDQLGLRDVAQTGRVSVVERRTFLQRLAEWFTQHGNTSISEDEFRTLVSDVFKNELRRYPTARRQVEIDSLFEDLRRSGSLTRMSSNDGFGWRFSHNSLREFLVAEKMVEELLAVKPSINSDDKPLTTDCPVSDAMMTFVASQPRERVVEQASNLASAWHERASMPNIGNYLALIWEGVDRQLRANRSERSPLREIVGASLMCDNVRISGIKFSVQDLPVRLNKANFHLSEISFSDFIAADLTEASFKETLLEAVSFRDATLKGADFSDALMVDVDLTGADLSGAKFSDVDESLTIIVEDDSTTVGRRTLSGALALGYLAFNGAHVENVDSYSFWINHPQFAIVEKVCGKLLERCPRQRLGLEQRGASAQNPQFARKFVRFLEAQRYVAPTAGRPGLLSLTANGRAVLTKVLEGGILSKSFAGFLDSELGGR